MAERTRKINAEKNMQKPPPPPSAPDAQSDWGKSFLGDREGAFPQQYHTIRANRERVALPLSLGSVGGYERRGGGAVGLDPGFDIPLYQRKFAVKNYHRLDVGRNISASVDVGLKCLACHSPHSIAEGLGAGRAQVFVVSDQAFLAALPTDDGRCLVVVRVEDGALSELTSVFCDIFAGSVAPAGSLPPGSVVLLGSLSHLSMRGISNYTEELVRSNGSLAAKGGTGVEVVPLVFAPLGGGQ
jgi:hypothetical protein